MDPSLLPRSSVRTRFSKSMLLFLLDIVNKGKYRNRISSDISSSSQRTTVSTTWKLDLPIFLDGPRSQKNDPKKCSLCTPLWTSAYSALGREQIQGQNRWKSTISGQQLVIVHERTRESRRCQIRARRDLGHDTTTTWTSEGFSNFLPPSRILAFTVHSSAYIADDRQWARMF